MHPLHSDWLCSYIMTMGIWLTNIIETLYSHGFCVSYAAARLYMTSIVMHEFDRVQTIFKLQLALFRNTKGCLI